MKLYRTQRYNHETNKCYDVFIDVKPQQDSRQRQIQQKEESGKSLAATGLVKGQKKI